MESASPCRHTLQAAAVEPEELSAYCGVGGTRLAMMVDQTRRKCRGCELASGRHHKGLAAGFSAHTGAFHRKARDRAPWQSRCARACWPRRRWPCCDCCAPAHPAPIGGCPERPCPRPRPRSGTQRDPGDKIRSQRPLHLRKQLSNS